MRKLYEAVIGERNTNYYLSRFEKFAQDGNRINVSWNWCAFLFNAWWALYRKMYGWFFGLFAISVVWGYILEDFPVAGLIVQWCFVALFSLFANNLYFKSETSRIQSAKENTNDEQMLIEVLRRKGGVNRWVIWVMGVLVSILLICMLTWFIFFIATPTSQASC